MFDALTYEKMLKDIKKNTECYGVLDDTIGILIGIIGGVSTISNVTDKVRKCFSKEEIKPNSFYFLY